MINFSPNYILNGRQNGCTDKMNASSLGKKISKTNGHIYSAKRKFLLRPSTFLRMLYSRLIWFSSKMKICLPVFDESKMDNFPCFAPSHLCFLRHPPQRLGNLWQISFLRDSSIGLGNTCCIWEKLSKINFMKLMIFTLWTQVYENRTQFSERMLRKTLIYIEKDEEPVA